MEDGFSGFFGRLGWLRGLRSGGGFGRGGSFDNDGFGIFGFFVLEELFGGEFDEVTVGILKVGGAGELADGEIVAKSESDLGDNEFGTRRDDDGAEEMPSAFGEDFDETIIKAMDGASGNVAERDEGAGVFAAFFDEVRLGVADAGDFGISVNTVSETVGVEGDMSFVDEICGETEGFGDGAVGRRFTSQTIADGVDVFGASFEIFVTFDTFVTIFDAGGFEIYALDIGGVAGGEDDTINADHFVGVFVTKNDFLAEFVFFDGVNFTVGEDGDALLVGEVTSEDLANLGVFAGEEMRGFFEKKDFDAELGVVFGNFDAGRAATNDSGDARTSSETNGGGGGEMIDERDTGDVVVLRVSASGEDKKGRGVFVVADGNSVSV